MEIVTNNNFSFILKEYEKLKDEQIKRIEYRDHMIYLTLVATGGIFSFAFDKPDHNIAYLVLPFLCLVLGWTYLDNDIKISKIGSFVITVLLPKLKNIHPNDNILITDTWEEFLRKDPLRKKRKWFQLFIDQTIFCFSSIISLATFFLIDNSISWTHILIAIIEVLLIIFLSIQIYKYADLK